MILHQPHSKRGNAGTANPGSLSGRFLIAALALAAATSAGAELPGDLNDDKMIGYADLRLMRDALGQCATAQPHRQRSDLDGDGCTTIADALRLLTNYGKHDVLVELVQLGDRPFALDSQDYLEITFPQPPIALALSDLQLIVTGDSFGAVGAEAPADPVRFDWPYGTNARVARIYLGAETRLRVGGRTTPQRTAPGSPSGLMIQGQGPFDLRDRRTQILQRAQDAYYPGYQPRVTERAQAGDACLDNYALSYDLEGLLSMFEATGHTRYLDEAIRVADVSIADARDMDDDGYLDFRATTHTLNDNQATFNIALCDWKAGRPLARLARLLNDVRRDAPRYTQVTDRFGQLARRELVEKWSSALNPDTQTMFFPASVFQVENDPLIHRVAHYGDIVVDTLGFKPDPNVAQVLEKIMARVCADLEDNVNIEGAVEWDIFMRPQVRSGPIVRQYTKPYTQISDTSHANGTVSFLVAAALRAGQSCTQRDVLQALSVTFKRVITQPPDATTNSGIRFTDFVDGGVLQDGQPPYSIGRFIEDGWLKLGEYDAEVQAIGQAFLNEGKPVHRLQFLGNLARNYELARWH